MWTGENRLGGLKICGLLGVSMMLGSLAGCDWLFGSSSPSDAEKARPGAERQVAPSNALPTAGGGRGYDAGAVPIDETRSGPKIGSIVPDKGGQKAQLDAAAKEAAERDKAAREEREKAAAEAAERKAKEPPKEATKEVSPKEVVWPKDADASSKPPPTQPSVPDTGQITTGAPPPPSATPDQQNAAPTPAPAPAARTQADPPAPASAAPAPAPAPAAAAAKPADPNKAFSPPPGWVPPVATQPAATAPPAPAQGSTPVAATPGQSQPTKQP